MLSLPAAWQELLIVTPHASGQVPAEVQREMLGEQFFDLEAHARLSEHLFQQGDPYTDLIYAVPEARFLTAPWSRFVVDLNRHRHDRKPNGVIKRTSFWGEALYPEGFVLSEDAREERLKRYWDPFDAALRRQLVGARLLIVGHSMSAYGPLLGPDLAQPRPALTLMLGTRAAPTVPAQHWDALQAACAVAFAPALGEPWTQVAVGYPWTTDVLSRRHHADSGIPAFGLEINMALYLDSRHQARPERVRLLNACFTDFAAQALALLTGER